jgi:hypothetical protein
LDWRIDGSSGSEEEKVSLDDSKSLRYGRLPILVPIDAWKQILQSIDMMDDEAKVPSYRAQDLARSRNGVMCASKGQAIPAVFTQRTWTRRGLSVRTRAYHHSCTESQLQLASISSQLLRDH